MKKTVIYVVLCNIIFLLLFDFFNNNKKNLILKIYNLKNYR